MKSISRNRLRIFSLVLILKPNQRRTSLTDRKNISNILRIQSLSQPQTWRSSIWEGKCRDGSQVYYP